MSKPTHDTRRRLLKGLLAGAGTATTLKALPERWTQPAVDVVVLPAHATTTEIPTEICTCSLTGTTDPQGSTDRTNPTSICQGDTTQITACLGCPIAGVTITFTALFNNDPFDGPRDELTDASGCADFGVSDPVGPGTGNTIEFRFEAQCPGEETQTVSYFYETNTEECD